MSYVNTQKRPRLIAAFPESKSTILVLHSLKTLYVAGDRRLDLRLRWQSFGVERMQNVAQRCYRKDARCELLGTLIWIVLKIEKCIGKLL